MTSVCPALCPPWKRTTTSARADNQYWRDTKTRPLPDGLAERIECWQTQLPDTETLYPYYHGLPPYSYMCILLGMGGIELKPSPALRLADESAARKQFQEIHDQAESLIDALPSPHEYFTHMRR